VNSKDNVNADGGFFDKTFSQITGLDGQTQVIAWNDEYPAENLYKN